MTTKQKKIIIKNLEEVIGVTTGKSVKGKGIEIFEADKSFDSSWSYGLKDGSFHARLLAKIEKEQVDLNRLVIQRFYRENDDCRRYIKPSEFPSIADVVSGKALADCTEIYIDLKGEKLYGYLPLSKYDATDIHSMEQLAKDVYVLMGYKTSDEVLDSSYSDFDSVMKFKEEYEWTGNRDCYRHIHGGLTVMDTDWSEVIYQDWSLSNYNDGVNDDFWNYEIDCEQDYLKNELDPEGTISVYAYKGKKGYIGYSLEEQEFPELYYLDEDGEEATDYAKFLTWKENPELLEKVATMFKDLLKNVEVKGYVYNELRERSYSYYKPSDSAWLNNDDVFNLNLIDAMYKGDRCEFAHEIIDLVNFDEISDDWKSPAIAVQRAYEGWIEKNVIGKTDDGRFEQFIALVADSGYTLTQTPIPQTDYVQNCVAYKNEEYHFFLGELYGADSASAFFGKIQAALAKRLMEKLEQTALIQKSVNVFVGFNDSIESGNCQSGTQEFCHRHHIDTKHIGGLRGDVILGMEFSNFTRRAVMQAIVRQGGAA
jgi:hypothetical protein